MSLSFEPRFLSRRDTLKWAGALALGPLATWHALLGNTGATASILPTGDFPEALKTEHFPSRLHALVWRNWMLIPLERLAQVVGCQASQLAEIGAAMGLGAQTPISEAVKKRSFLSVIRCNWHLLPYEQLLELLGWNEEQLAFALREDDFLYVKLGKLKPKVDRLGWFERDENIRSEEKQIAQWIAAHFGSHPLLGSQPLFQFLEDLSSETELVPLPENWESEPLRYCYSYFALYGDPLLEPELDPYPNGYLQKLRAQGVNGVWLQGMLSQLAPFPWEPERSAKHELRLENLRKLVKRARERGIKIYLYLNEPRSLPVEFFKNRKGIQGITIEDHTMMCTSVKEVQEWMTKSVEFICREVPDLGGFFTISVSENPTNCWSHGKGKECPRCGPRGPAEIVAEVNSLLADGIRAAGGKQRLVVWDWAWKAEWDEDAIRKLPKDVTFMSVSEWDLPISRGGVESKVGEYCLSAVGPGPRAKRRWKVARECGLKVAAKLQASLTWEFSSAPYLPVLANVSNHAERLRAEGVKDYMLSWTLGGHPSPNFACYASDLESLAKQWLPHQSPELLKLWQSLSTAMSEFPYHIGVVYNAPLQLGPANPLYDQPTSYRATMVGFGYDDLPRWRAIYPPEVFIQQLQKVAEGFGKALEDFKTQVKEIPAFVADQLRYAEVARLHWESVALQAQFVVQRDASQAEGMSKLLDRELEIAKRLHALQSQDTRIGFEASNHYYYVPLDLVEKVLNVEFMKQKFQV